MESPAKLHHSRRSAILSLNHHRPSFATPFSSISFRALPPYPSSLLQLPSSSFSSSSIRASSSSSLNPGYHQPINNVIQPLQSLNPFFSTLVRSITVAGAAAAFFFMRLQHKPAIAIPIMRPTVESTKDSAENVSNDEKERTIEEQLRNNPDDTEAIRALMEIKIRLRKLEEAIRVIDRLIELEPEEIEWPLLKAHMRMYNGDHDSARNEFENILKKDPYRADAYHGLVMATSEMNQSLSELLKRVEDAMELCVNQNRNSEVRDFKLLIAQVKVIEGQYFDALKTYKELEKEEPRDFRPYLCQGIVYTLLKRNGEAEKQFEKFRMVVPENHPFKEYFDENMFATQFLSRKGGREGTVAKN